MTRLRVCRLAAPRVVLVAILGSMALPAQAQLLAQRAVAVETDLRRTAPPPGDELFARPVTVTLSRVPLRSAVDAIAASAGVLIQYQAEVLGAVSTPVSLRAQKMPLGVALDQILAGTRLHAVSPVKDVLTIQPIARAEEAVQETVRGLVTDAKTKRPIAGTTVLLDDATKGVVTDANGEFRLTAAAGQHRITIRAIGYMRQSRTITVSAGQSVALEFALDASASVLDEVIVTGTVVATERKEIPTPITVITAADIERRGITRVEQLLRGEVPGVIALEQGSSVYDFWAMGGTVTAKVYTRGASSTSGSTTPLKTYIDGVELLDASYLGTIDPKSIERIEIITGPQAATIYGSGAMGGVMQIFTKKGMGRSTPDITVSLRYGMMENSITDGLTPSHTDVISLAGGTGPEFSYSGNLSYNYIGQWQPFLFNRTYGASVGATHTRGPVTASGSVSATAGENGTFVGSAVDRVKEESGEWQASNYYNVPSQRRSKMSSQTIAVNIDYTAFSVWQHHLTVGRSQNDFNIIPLAPIYMQPADSLFYVQTEAGKRTTVGYNTTIVTPALGPFRSTLTVGANGSTGDQTYVYGEMVSPSATVFANPFVRKDLDAESWGGFGSLRVGFFDKVYVTVGLRGERNPSYGRAHKVDWTPTNGVAYTMELGDLTMKLLGSYGRATRPPTPKQRLGEFSLQPTYEPSRWASTLPNPDLTPEYSRGPQGGIELYYGNWGSLTINHYQQRVTDLIQQLVVDSIQLYATQYDIAFWSGQFMYVNSAIVRQRGWEGTGSLNLGPLSLKGTWSYSDSRTTYIDPRSSEGVRVFTGLPSHTGNVSVSYARGGLSMMLSTSIIGRQLSGLAASPVKEDVFSYIYLRLPMYGSRGMAPPRFDITDVPGYAKSDFTLTQRMTSWASFTMNVNNLGNSYGREQLQNAYNFPTLGRITTLGVSLRYPNSSR